jgi:uncharacterized protein YuzE
LGLTVTVKIAGIEFDQVAYDEQADVLYLALEGRGEVATTTATPEGHAVQLDGAGRIIGLTLVNARWLTERDRRLVITLPQRFETTAEDFTGVWEAVK